MVKIRGAGPKRLADRFARDSPICSFVHLNQRVLAEACGHAHVDLTRMVVFPNVDPITGGTTKPHKYKFAGFVSRWIAKSHPIYVDDGKPLPRASFKLNAYFALYVFRSYLTYKLPPEVVGSLAYSFHFRDVRSETLALIAYTLDICLHTNSPKRS